MKFTLITPLQMTTGLDLDVCTFACIRVSFCVFVCIFLVVVSLIVCLNDTRDVKPC